MNSQTRVVSLIALLAFAPVTLASTPPEDVNGEEEESRSRIEIFIGGTSTDDESAFTLGIAYEYRLRELLGVGGVVEHAAGEIGATATIGEVFFHPLGGLRLAAGVGIQFPDEEGNEFVTRASIAYEFERRLFAITPEFNFDFVDGEVEHVYGVNFGFGLK